MCVETMEGSTSAGGGGRGMEVQGEGVAVKGRRREWHCRGGGGRIG